MRPQSMSMLGVFAMMDLLAMFALFQEPTAEPSRLALCEPAPADFVAPLSDEDVHLTAQHKEFLNELRQRVEPRVGPSDDDSTPVPVHQIEQPEDPSQRSVDDASGTSGAGDADALAASAVGI